MWVVGTTSERDKIQMEADAGHVPILAQQLGIGQQQSTSGVTPDHASQSRHREPSRSWPCQELAHA